MLRGRQKFVRKVHVGSCQELSQPVSSLVVTYSLELQHLLSYPALCVQSQRIGISDAFNDPNL